MKNFRILLLVALIALAASPAASQPGNSSFGLAWSLSLPTGDMKEFTDDFSLRGFNLEYRRFQRSDLAFGLNVGYNVFNEEQDDTFIGENFAVTGKQWTYINTVPIYASVFKFSSSNKRDGRFFFGGNAGTAWLEQRRTLGLYETKEDNWHLAVAPEVGYHFPWDAFLGYASVRYNYLFEAGEVPAQGWIEIKLGFGMD